MLYIPITTPVTHPLAPSLLNREGENGVTGRSSPSLQGREGDREVESGVDRSESDPTMETCRYQLTVIHGHHTLC